MDDEMSAADEPQQVTVVYRKPFVRPGTPQARAQGLTYIELTTQPDNIASQRVILNNGGRLIGRFQKPEAYGGGEGLRYLISV